MGASAMWAISVFCAGCATVEPAPPAPAPAYTYSAPATPTSPFAGRQERAEANRQARAQAEAYNLAKLKADAHEAVLARCADPKIAWIQTHCVNQSSRELVGEPRLLVGQDGLVRVSRPESVTVSRGWVCPKGTDWETAEFARSRLPTIEYQCRAESLGAAP